jgi:phage terminase large subunit GpA-like protein
MANLAEIWSRAAAELLPPRDETLSEWIERTIQLPQGLSADPGPVTLWPPQREIADSIGDPDVERVSWLKSVRSGYTFLLTAAIARDVRDAPQPIITLLPTLSDARDYIVSDLEPLFAASPSLRGLLSEPDKHEDRSTLLHRLFPGGSLKVIAAKAPRNLRRHTARAVFADEIDAMDSVEGNILKLAERRTLTFARRKLVCGSSPKVEDTSLIAALYASSDQRVYEIECPACGDHFELLWRHIEWKPGEPESAHAVCPECGGVIEEADKPRALERGRWRATAPTVKGHHGYKLNALVSLLPNCVLMPAARYGLN